MLPKWAIQIVLHKAMANIFESLETTAKRMATDSHSAHARLANSPAYQPTASWIRGKVDAYTATLAKAQHS